MPISDRIRKRLDIAGVVQGVGFRPFVHQLARRCALTGWVLNDAHGVTAEIEGEPAALESFLAALEANPPPLAKIAAIREEIIPPLGDAEFVIRQSVAGAERRAFISPDTHTCDDCLREMFDPADRRYRYPFINCTNCGPRYTIITDIPYDRPNTTMRRFPMCADCRREYEDPSDRRFHAQPVACPNCGPKVELLDSDGKAISTQDPIRDAAARLKHGQIGAIKGLGGFHLACDAANESAVRMLRKRKRREEKPFAVMAGDLGRLRRFAFVSEDEQVLLRSFRRPIVLLRKRVPEVLAPSIAPGNRFVGAVLPYTPIQHLLFAEDFPALVMTSANLSDEPICIENAEAVRRLTGIADFFLVHDRDIHARCDDSIARVMAGRARVLRRARGYVPLPVALRDDGPRILAVGAELKGAVCLAKGKSAFLSQHLGDLDNDLAWRFFEEAAGGLQRILEIEPEAVAHDLHPDYVSTRYARECGLPTVPVQHHHAHIAAVLAEHGEAGPVLGVALDGTGYGPDGTIWGGEFLLADLHGFRRAGHLSPMPLPGGDAAIKEPWRTAVAYLCSAFGDEWAALDIPFVRDVSPDKSELIVQMVRNNVNCIRTSSAGRLFDVVSSLLGICHENTYEGQAPMMLEMAAREDVAAGLLHHVRIENGLFLLDVPFLVRSIVDRLRERAPVEFIAAEFHNGLAHGILDICLRLRECERFTHVALSGGVFQNAILFERLVALLEGAGLATLTHELVPPNDGGIALGQAAVARAKRRRQ